MDTLYIQEGDQDQTVQGSRRHKTPPLGSSHLFLGIKYRGDSSSFSLRPFFPHPSNSIPFSRLLRQVGNTVDRILILQPLGHLSHRE